MNNYEILGLQKGASISEVKSKFRQLSKKYHPDMPDGNAAKFISIRKAYEALLKGDSGEPQFSGGFGSGHARDSRSQDERFWQAWHQQQYQSSRGQWGQQQSYQQSNRNYRKPARYRFIGIGKDEYGYVLKIFVDGVDRVEVYGKKGFIVGIYSVRGKYGEVRLGINWKDAELAEYEFEILLEDANGYYDSIRYKVKKPLNGWEKLFNKLKFWK